METTDNSKSCCALKCLRNVEDISNSVHPLKYGMNTIGRGLNNDVVLKNLNVSRTHCHLWIEKQGSIDIASIKDLGTSNGTIVGNTNLLENKEHKLNNLDMIVLASGVEGVVLQFINQIDQTINLSNLCINQINNKRKIPPVDNLDELTAVKIPKLGEFKEPLLNGNSNQSKKSNDLPNITNNLPCKDLNQPSTSSYNVEPVKDSNCQILQADEVQVILNNEQPSCSNHTLTSVQIKTEPNIPSSRGTYRSEEDSVIVIYSSDEENNINDNYCELNNVKIEQDDQINLNSIPIENTCSSAANIENDLNRSEWVNQVYEILSDDEDDISFMPSKIDSRNDAMISSNNIDCGYNNNFPEIIEPLPLKSKIKKESKLLSKNVNIIKTRAKSAKNNINKKKAEELTVDQNKLIIESRRIKLQQLSKKFFNVSTETNTLINDQTDESINKPSITDILNKKTRISRSQKCSNNNSTPSTSKAHLTIEPKVNEQFNILKKVSFNPLEEPAKKDMQIINNLSSNCNSMNNQIYFSFFDTISKICKWNAVWLHEEKFTGGSPPLVKKLYKMKGKFENSSEYSTILKPLLLHEVWSNISKSYNIVISKNPSLEKSIFEKSLKKDMPLLTLNVQCVNKAFSQSLPSLKHITEKLWSIKCMETNIQKNIISTGFRSSLKGCLCIAIIQSKHFETNAIKVKTPTKSRNIFFAYVNAARKIGFNGLCIELIVTQKTENIPDGTSIHLLDIYYLHPELRLFQAVDNITTSLLCNALITPQLHNYTVDCSIANLKNYNINSLMLNNSQKEAIKMAVSICSSSVPNIGLIIGPPGTGKTNVICTTVLTVISKLRSETTVKPKFLICAPSNEAVDTLVRRFIEIKNDTNNKLQFNVVRVGAGQKYDAHSPIVDVMLDNIVKQKMNNLNEDNGPGESNTLSLFTNKKEHETDVLQNTDIVVTTLNSCFSNSMDDIFSPSKNETFDSCHFTACIVDEAGQCVEPLNCVPLLLGINKLILVGDDKQLQPLVKSQVAKDNGLGISLFKRLKKWFEQNQYAQKNKSISILDTQYRMHNEICLFPSQYFYGGKIKTAPSVKTRVQLPFQPYIILEHESLQDNSGELNMGEAIMIVSLVDIIMHSECSSLAIAILTPYQKQKEHINMLLKNKEISINANTVDSFQGSECDILLISTVRTTGIGFMDDICRLNVALTRAKQSLIICGNFKSLRGERVWCDLLENAKKRKLIKKVSKKCMTNSRALCAMIKC